MTKLMNQHVLLDPPDRLVADQEISPPNGPPPFVLMVRAFVGLSGCKLLKNVGRGEWIRTTDLLVPNQTALPNSMITQ
jgi:hypothetical protein